jgi:hypothetical protein
MRGEMNMNIRSDTSFWFVKQIERYKSSFCSWVAEENIADYGCYQETDRAAAQIIL